ncbi:MAG: hypothetical protein IH908_05450 [Proteobacteria bacterium]|nr:hypothetical protein [Pseudomonadota bacterium]
MGRFAVIFSIFTLLVSAGCATLMSSVTAGLTENLANAILDNADLVMVRDGAPAYLILIDGLVAQSPDNVNLLSQAAMLNSVYAATFVEDEKRNQALQSKALDFASRATCRGIDDGCEFRTRPYPEFERWLAGLDGKQVPLLYRLGGTWAGWIQAHGDDFVAIAELGRVKALMSRVIELDEGFDHGGAHLYMGVFETILPPGLGGKPEVGRKHFERAVELSGGRNMLTKVMFAEQYARLVFDRELHDQLLQEVLATDPVEPGLTLINVVAQERAATLLESADAYF